MTHNQIAYWELQETRNHNTATRAETARTNRANEAIKRASNVETQRHNSVVESIDQYNAFERSRANRASEAETHRSNVARETETNRHNLAQEGYADREVSVKESLLPSQIAANYGKVVGSGSKLLTGLSNVLGSSGPLYALVASKRNKDKSNNNSNSGSSNGGGGSSSATKSPARSAITPSLGRVLTPSNDKLSDVTNKIHQGLENQPDRSSGGSWNGGKSSGGRQSNKGRKDVPIVDAALNTALATATRVALAPYLGPAASGVAAAMPYIANKISHLITP